MSGLFAEAGPADVSLEDQLACVDRELAMRRKVYPRWVKNGKLTQAAADLEILKMRGVRRALLRGEALERAWTMNLPSDSDLERFEAELGNRYPESS